MHAEITVECAVQKSFRTEQICGMFDMKPDAKAKSHFAVEVPGLETDWQIGLIVGPSGSGKSTVARHVFGEQFYQATAWPEDAAVVDAFPETVGIREITQTLSSVGFSSPPSWLKPYKVLSNGEKFRCDLARAMLCGGDVVAFDEFTSLVDRTVARVGSAALAKAIRNGRFRKRFVAVTCHYDIAEWLQPDWIVDMATQSLARGSLQRPPINLTVRRVDKSAWRIFERHHYLSADLHPSAACYVGSIDGSPAAFVSVIHFPHPIMPGWKGHRTVVLPDFQGLNIGNKLHDYVASLYRATGKPYRDVTSHPSLGHYRMRSPNWKCNRIGRHSAIGNKTTLPMLKNTASWNRITMSFEYVGPARREDARAFGINGVPDDETSRSVAGDG